MPRCFALTKKGENEPTKLQAIDDEMRVAFGEPPDADNWLWHWHDGIGPILAYGKTWDQVREVFWYSHELLRVVDYLEERYVPDCWQE